MMKNNPLSTFRMMLLGALTAGSIAAAATVNLSGTVSTSANVDAAGTTGPNSAASLNLGGRGIDIGEQIVKVADLTLTTNNSTGLTLTISTNSTLTNGVPSADITYKVLTVAEGATPVGTDFTKVIADPYSTVDDTDPTNVARDLFIAYTPAVNQDPGTYTGAITLTVADN